MYTANNVNKAEEIYSILKERNPGKKITVVYDYNKKMYELNLANEKYTNDPEIPLDLSMKVIYGDSVVPDTPILVRSRIDELVDIRSIEDLFCASATKITVNINGKEEVERNDIQVYTRNGWNNVEKIIRHKTNKELYRVSNHRGIVTVTEDHSLLTSRGHEIKPVDCTMYTNLLYSFPKCFPDKVDVPEECAFAMGVLLREKPYLRNTHMNIKKEHVEKFINGLVQIIPNCVVPDIHICKEFDDIVEIKYLYEYENDITNHVHEALSRLEDSVPYPILNSRPEAIVSYLAGYLYMDIIPDVKRMDIIVNNSIECAGFYYLLKILEYKVDILSETQLYAYDYDCLSDQGTDTEIMSEFGRLEETVKINPLCIHLLERPDSEYVYVYDIQTEQGTFQAGIGETIVKNTDSIFIEMKYNRESEKLNRHDTFKVASICGKKLTDDVFNRKPIEMEFEKVFQPFILLTKKRYIGKKFEDLKDPMKMKEITAAGIALTRRDYSKFVKECYTGVIDEIINNADVDAGIRVYKDYIKKLEDDTVDISSLVLSAQLAKEYKTSPVHVILAKKLKDRKEEVQVGDRIPYIYIHCDDPKVKKSELGEDPTYAKLNGLKINKKCYLEQLAKPLLGFFKVVLKEHQEKMENLIDYTNKRMVMFGGTKLKNSEFILPATS